jgi:hypothetical protein
MYVAIGVVYAYEIIGTDLSLRYGGILELTDLWWSILPKLITSRPLLENVMDILTWKPL